MSELIGRDYVKIYGLQPMTFDEELAAPDNVKQTRRNKMTIIDNCAFMKRAIESVESRAKRIPEEDDAAHAKLIDDWCRKVLAVEEELWGLTK